MKNLMRQAIRVLLLSPAYLSRPPKERLNMVHYYIFEVMR